MLTYNCARVYVGSYIGGGTNEFERCINCGYKLLDGEIVAKKLRPIQIQDTTSEGNFSALDTFALYPKSEIAIVNVSNGKRKFLIRLIKSTNSKSTIFKLRL